MTVRFGLLGAGRIGKVHARAIRADAEAQLVAVADAIPAAAQAIANDYGCEIRTIEAIEAASDIDAVVICTPTDTHADLIERFARAGKAVFCEKPIDLNVSRVKDCLRVVQETAQVENIIRTLKAQGTPLILISHNLRQVFDLADRIVVFRRGHIVANLRKEETDGNDIVAYITGVKTQNTASAMI